jgi:hypothetical protein
MGANWRPSMDLGGAATTAVRNRKIPSNKVVGKEWSSEKRKKSDGYSLE